MKSIVLFSAGLDSAVAFKKAYDICEEVICLTFDYGQRAAPKETACAKNICDIFGVEHHVIRLPWFDDFNSALTGKGDVPTPDTEDLDDIEKSLETAKAVWVPARNMVFLSIAASFAENYDFDLITTGLDEEEAVTFPDNSKEFIDLFNRAMEYGTLNKPTIHAPLAELSKTDIVKFGVEIDAPMKYSWSCYHAGAKPCGECESCKRRARAFLSAGVEDILE